MARFLVAVTHDPRPLGCLKAIRVFLTTGSHYLAGADWGCYDGDHTAWMIVDAASKDEALQIVPPQFHAETRVTALGKFEIDQVERMLREHGG